MLPTTTVVLSLLATLGATNAVPNFSTSNNTLVARGGTQNIWQGRCNWNFHKDNAYNYGEMIKWGSQTGFLQYAKQSKANEIFWCISGLCLWTDRDGTDEPTIRAAVKKMSASNCCGSCGTVALHGNDMSRGTLTLNYPSECHDMKTGQSTDCNQFAIVDKCDL